MINIFKNAIFSFDEVVINTNNDDNTSIENDVVSSQYRKELHCVYKTFCMGFASFNICKIS